MLFFYWGDRMDKKDNIYFIEGVADKDLVGYDSYVDSLDSAIKSGAKFIGLISDYGNGKSTLLKMLKKSDYGVNYDLVTINLWNCDENDKEKNNVDIHRVFLHQLVEETNIKSKSYYKKKIDKNYSIFDIKVKEKSKFYIFSLSLFLVLCFFEKLGFITLFINELSLLGYLLISILCILNIMIYNPVIAYKKAEPSEREIDENDTKDLYNEIIKEYNEKNTEKTLVICLEELDRYNNCAKVLEYLKEFYKFYRESHNNNRIVFIISIKSASQLLSLNKDKEKMNINDVKSTYEKLFDYILNLRPINIHDYDAVVLKLLKTKQNVLSPEIKIPKNTNIKEWKYLYKGDNIKIRDIKHRYNFAIALYLSIKENGIKPDINKCLFIAYLEDEYNELYNLLITKKDLLNTILIKYASREKIDKETISSLEVLEDKDFKVIYEGLNSKYISIDYNYYFYKFPLHKAPFDIYEYDLHNAIFFDNDTRNVNDSLKKLKDDKILKIIDKRANENILPEIIFKYPKLYILTFEKRNKVLENTIKLNYNIINNYDKTSEFLINTKKLPKRYFDLIIEIYKKLMLPEIVKRGVEERARLRLNLCKILGNDVEIFDNLFFNDNNIITKEEVNLIEDLRIVLKLINYDKFDISLLETIVSKINIVKASYKAELIKFIEILSSMDSISVEEFKKVIYSVNFSKYKFNSSQYNKLLDICKLKLELNNPSNYSKFIEHINYYSERYDSYYLEIINNGDIEKNTIKYKNTLIKFDMIFDKGMKYLDDYSREHTVYAFGENIRSKFYDNKYYDYYVISTRLEKQKFEIETEKFDILSKYYIKEFEYRKNWKCPISEDMKEFLYKNVNFSKLDSLRLIVFVKMIQTKDLIKAVLNTNDITFINNYLSKIDKIKNTEFNDIYRLIGTYKRDNNINRKAMNNLRTLTKNKKYLNYLDGRKRLEAIVS